jgi:hypothetical protein
MADIFSEVTHGQGVSRPAGQMITQDQGTGGVGPVTPIVSIIGLSEFQFDFFNEGGPNNLKPGRPTTQTVSYTAPGGAPGFVCLRSIVGAFVTDGGANLTERPLGEFAVNVFFAGPDRLSCSIILSDSNGDDPVRVIVRGLIVFFR